MKNLMIILVALILATSTQAASTAKKDKETIAQDRATLFEMAENREWIFQTSTNWSAGNLAYGPVEILAGAGVPVIGMFTGLAVGTATPYFFMKKGSEILLPFTIPCGAAAGAACGLAITPICVVEGVFNIITCGIFSDGYFSWVNTEGLKNISMKSVQDEITEADDVE